MKKNPFSYSRMVAAILIISAITCSVAWLTPSFARAKRDKPGKVATITSAPVKKEVMPVNKNDEEQPSTLPEKEQVAKVADHPSTPVKKEVVVQDNDTEENRLIKRMMADGLVDQVKGFVVEKMHDKLYINGQQQPTEIAEKYLSTLKSENIRVQVYSFTERLKMHPDASFIQILFPVQFSAGCVDYQPKKPGC